jgi:hypothetical protein
VSEGNPFTRKIQVRAVLLADANESWVIFGASNNSDLESYRHLVCGEWQEDVMSDAAAIVEFEIEMSTRPMAVARLPNMKVPKVPARARGGQVRAQNLTPERRREIASGAAKARWSKA